MVAIGTVLILVGWWLLAVAMAPRAATRRRALRLGGSAAFAVSLACYIVAIGVEQGPVFWTAVLMLGALAVALLRAIAGVDGGAGRGRR